jgi:hypothetical protein
MDDVTPIVAALKKSGFPLQTRIEHEIRARYASGWKVLASEHPWRSGDGDQFIDLIANCGTVVLVVESKKAQERSLLFLRPFRETTGKVRTCTVWHFEPSRRTGSSYGIDIMDIDLEPASYRAAFCVSTDKSSQRLLEQDARLVVSAADVLVEQFTIAHQLRRSFFLPVIVTTAPLSTLRYKPTDIFAGDGQLRQAGPEGDRVDPVDPLPQDLDRPRGQRRTDGLRRELGSAADVPGRDLSRSGLRPCCCDLMMGAHERVSVKRATKEGKR